MSVYFVLNFLFFIFFAFKLTYNLHTHNDLDDQNRSSSHHDDRAAYLETQYQRVQGENEGLCAQIKALQLKMADQATAQQQRVLELTMEVA